MLPNRKTFIILTVILAGILAGGLLAFCNYQKTKSTSQTSYQLALGQIAGTTSLDGVPIGLTPNHGQVVQIEISVIPQHTGGSNAVLGEFINTVDWIGDCTNSTYTTGETIIIYRMYQDGYAERTSGSILLTQEMLVSGPRGLLESGPMPKIFAIPTQQWVPA